jgi:hypothetical protein
MDNKYFSPWGGRTNLGYTQAVAPVAVSANNAAGQSIAALAGGLANVARGYSDNYGSYANAASKFTNAGLDGMSGIGNNYSQNYGALSGGLTGLAGTATQGLGGLGDGYTKNYGAYGSTLGSLGNSSALALQGLSQGLSGLGQSQSGAYGAYSGALGNVANAMSTEASNLYGANSQAEIARQTALGNLGVASLGAYGGIGNSALNAWSQNQQAYNKSLADINAANQAGMSQYGQSRNTGLGQMAAAYSDLGSKLGTASTSPSTSFTIGDGGGTGVGGDSGFLATGPDGQIASGQYTSPPTLGGGLGMTASGTKTADTRQLQALGAPAYAGLNTLGNQMMANDVTNSMNYNSRDAVDRLDAQQYSSRSMPSDIMSQALSGLQSLGRDAYDQSRSGMNQYYATQNDPAKRTDYSGVLGQLASGYNTSAANLNDLARDTTGAFGSTGNRLDSFANSAGSGYREANDNIRALTTPIVDLAYGMASPLWPGFDAANKNVGALVPWLNNLIVNNTLPSELGAKMTESNSNLTNAMGFLNNSVGGLWDRSVGNTGAMKSAMQNQREQWAIDDAGKARQAASAAEQKRKMDAFRSQWADEVNSGQRSPGMYGRR